MKWPGSSQSRHRSAWNLSSLRTIRQQEIISATSHGKADTRLFQPPQITCQLIYLPNLQRSLLCAPLKVHENNILPHLFQIKSKWREENFILLLIQHCMTLLLTTWQWNIFIYKIKKNLQITAWSLVSVCVPVSKRSYNCNTILVWGSRQNK